MSVDVPLRIVYDEYKSSFQQLLDKDNSVTIHQRNISIWSFLVKKQIIRRNYEKDFWFQSISLQLL